MSFNDCISRMIQLMATVTLQVILLPFTAEAQSGILFRSDYDISSSLIKQVLVDSRGMVWVATENGLNRFDGSKFTIYLNNKNDSTSIASNFIDKIFEDSKGNLFIVSFNGVQLYDYGSDSLTPVAKRADGKQIEGNPASMIEFPDGEIWTLGRTPMRLEVTSDRKLILHPIDLPPEITLISKAIADRNGGVWLAKGSEGLYFRDKKGSIKKYLGTPGDPVIEALTFGTNGNLYAGCMNTGLYRYDSKSDRFVNISPLLKGISIKSITTSPDGKIMVGTDKNGLYQFDPDDGSTRLVSIPFTDPYRAKVHSIAYDRFGNCWMGVFQKGVLMIPPQSEGFQRLTCHTPSFLSFNSSCVNAILEDKEGMLWVGTDNDGIYKFDSNHKPVMHLHDNTPSIVTGILEDSKGRLWISSYGDGIGTLDKSTGRFSPLDIVDKLGNVVKHSFGIAEDRDGNLWISTMGSGLFLMDGESGIIKPYDLKNSGNLWIPAIHYSPKDNTLFLGTYDGLHIVYLDSKIENIILPKRIIYAIDESSYGTHWVATSEGLAEIDSNGNALKIYTTDDGLMSSTIYSVAEGDGALWSGSSLGLSKLDLKTRLIHNYTVDDGLQSNEFSRNAVATGKDSTLYFGGINGLSYFNPSKINTAEKKQSVKVSDFYLKGSPVRTNTLSGRDPIITRPVFESDTFRLAYNDNSFAIEFTTADPKGSSQVEYWYAFDNNEWQKSKSGGTQPSIGKASLNFSDVPHGRHILKLKAVNNGVESDIKNIVIIVRPAWYQTIWAKFLYFILVTGVVAAIVMVYLQEQRRKRKELELAHEKEMNESRIQFLVNISHDIRTPMSLIIDPLRRLISSGNDGNLEKVYKLMLRNANRIMHLINEVMDFRKIEKGKMRLTIRETKATDFINDLIGLFRPAAANKCIEISFFHEGCDDLSIWVDYENFDKVMMNLLSNAIKYTPKNGKINVVLAKDEDNVRISVADTGEGVPVSEREKIFERFYQAPNHATGGTGVGLHITRALVQLHGGTISVESNKEAGKGSVFTVTIPAKPSKELNKYNSSGSDADSSVASHDHSSLNQIETVPSDQSAKKDKKLKSRKTVFIVEDDVEIRRYLSLELGNIYNVDEFSNGKQALDAIFRQHPDLIISDVMMPEMNGIELTKAIKQNVELNTLPVILLTAKVRNEDNIAGLDAGADAYMSKPFNIDVLLARVATLIENYSRLKKAFDGSQSQERHVQKIETVSNDDKLMERMMRVINENLSDPDLTVEMIADKIGISRVHLYRKTKDITNQSPKEFIRNYRLRRSAELLVGNKLNIAQISDFVGFSSPNNFSSAFKKLYGLTPTEYAAQKNLPTR